MSFFGFDSSQGASQGGRGGNKGIFEHSNPFTEVQNARKLQAFQNTEEDMYASLSNLGLTHLSHYAALTLMTPMMAWEIS